MSFMRPRIRRRVFPLETRRTGLLIIACLLLLPVTAVRLAAQDAPSAAETEGGLPAGFGNVELGMDIDTVKERLQEDRNFRYRGDPDVTLTPARDQQVIEVEGLLFVDRAFLQFHDGELYILILHLNRDRLDYYTLYTDFDAKFGEPTVFHPRQVVWESEEVRLSLERPLTVKYVLRPVFESIVAAGEMERSERDRSREEFLEQF